jgi:hypothetical protein
MWLAALAWFCRQWDRFAQFEYMKLAEEEEMGAAEPADDSAMGGW